MKKSQIKLPVTPNGSPDFDYMTNYISALEKQAIKPVIDYKNQLFEQTKEWQFWKHIP